MSQVGASGKLKQSNETMGCTEHLHAQNAPNRIYRRGLAWLNQSRVQTELKKTFIFHSQKLITCNARRWHGRQEFHPKMTAGSV